MGPRVERDAEAICEAAQRPGMRYVAVKSEEQQGARCPANPAVLREAIREAEIGRVRRGLYRRKAAENQVPEL